LGKKPISTLQLVLVGSLLGTIAVSYFAFLNSKRSEPDPPQISSPPVNSQTLTGRASANRPERTNAQAREISPSPPRQAKPRQAVYYRPGETFGKHFPSLDGCNQARERNGNVGVCVMK
jgi:hypothetical protein